MTQLSDLADELERLANDATPGPWASEPNAIVTLDPVELDMERRMIADLRYFTIPKVEQNAALIVALRNNLLEILSALRRVDALLSPDAGGDQRASRDHALSAGSALERWQPIETAPRRKDGEPHQTVLLAWTHSDGTVSVGEAYWHPTDPVGGDWWWENTGPSDYYADTIANSITGQITHWMPLPAPPSSAMQTPDAVPGTNPKTPPKGGE